MHIGFAGLLAIVFIVLKLTGVIGWSWWWVLSPLWIGFVLAIPIIAIGYWLQKKSDEWPSVRRP